MDLKEIMSVSGHSGLFKFVSQGRNGIIVESFADKKRLFVSASQKVSSLSEIAIFTDGDEVPLKDVFKNIHQNEPGIPAPDAKSDPEQLKKFMEKALPNYDHNRVYISDIKKLVTWYNILLDMKLLDFSEEKAEETISENNAERTAPENADSQNKTAPSKTKKSTSANKKNSTAKK